MEKRNKIGLLYIVSAMIIIVLVQSVYGSYAVSSPKTIILEDSSSKEFDFQIQAYNSDYDLECSYSIEDTAPFEIKFEKNIFVVNKKSYLIVNGVVSSPTDIDNGNYNYSFCVSCLPKIRLEGAVANINFCGIPIKIIVNFTEKEIILAEENSLVEKEKYNYTNISTLVAVLLIIFALIIILIYTRRQKLKKRKV